MARFSSAMVENRWGRGGYWSTPARKTSISRPMQRRGSRSWHATGADTLVQVDPEPKEFKDVTIYTLGNVLFPNVARIDATKAKIWIGPYALHKNCVRVEFTRKGKRKTEILVSSDKPYVVVVPTANAIQPDDLYLPPNAGVSTARYGITDPRWKTDFEEQLRSANVPILADYRNIFLAVEISEPSLELQVRGNQRLVYPSEQTPHLETELANLEYEEGPRSAAERDFFNRNPQLAKQAKEMYGCTCQVCGFDFGKTYGPLGLNFAEAHHRNPLSERPPEEWTTAVRTN